MAGVCNGISPAELTGVGDGGRPEKVTGACNDNMPREVTGFGNGGS